MMRRLMGGAAIAIGVVACMVTALNAVLHSRLEALCIGRAQTTRGMPAMALGETPPAVDWSQLSPEEQKKNWDAAEDALEKSTHGYPTREELANWSLREREFYRRAVQDAENQREHAAVCSATALILGVVCVASGLACVRRGKAS